MDAILHIVGEKPQRFQFLAQALKAADEQKATGYIVTPSNEVIHIRKGKRPSVDGKRWVPCKVGL